MINAFDCIIYDYNEIAADSNDAVSQIVSHTANTWQANRGRAEKVRDGVFERNVLDDMRLSLELLLKVLLHNDKSLENQIPELGAFLKAKGIQTEIRNMYVTLLKYYLQYQNNHVKHNDEINPNEMEYIIDLTSLFMKFLLK